MRKIIPNQDERPVTFFEWFLFRHKSDAECLVWLLIVLVLFGLAGAADAGVLS